jgi:GNAT superfamily N-acetyltransferase
MTVELLADRPELVSSVGELRWAEWGVPPESQDLSWWVEMTAAEAGKHGLPIIWVAVDGAGRAVGAVGLGEFDIEEVVDRTPWVLGMIVDADHRGKGIGRQLMRSLEAWSSEHGFSSVWVATERAEGFYRRCGWHPVETITKHSGDKAWILEWRRDA